MENVYEYLTKELNIKYGDSIVVGVSGGPDSMCLLHLLIRLKKVLDIEVICAHVNHNVRPESVDERVFVHNFCLANNIIFESMVIEDYGDDNFHNEARTKRYNYFSTIVKKYHAKYLLTAHHADDLMETILMRIVRGSTLRGYSGFSKVVDMGDYQIIRPLINVTKDDIMKYNKENNISFVEDKSNYKDVYTRNRFRKYIVPEFRKEDPSVYQKFYKFSLTLLEYNNYMDQQVKKIIKRIYPQGVLNIELFLKEDHLIQMKIIYYILEYIYQDDLMLVTDTHAQLIYNLILSKKANVKLFLPNNVKAIKAYNTLTLVKDNQNSDEYEIQITDFVNLPNGKNIQTIKRSADDSNNICRLDSREVKLPLHVRNRQNGDKMTIKGMIGNRKINDIFIDDKIPLEERKAWPIVMDSNGIIVWLPGLKKSKFSKTKSEKYDIILKYY